MAEDARGMSWGELPTALAGLPALDDAPIAGAPSAPARPPLGRLARAVQHDFGELALLRVAVTHPGWANEHRSTGWPSNGCLEFYGDAVLDLLAADAIWRRFPDLSEGELTRLRASVVSEATLAEMARELDLGAYLYLGRGDEKSGFRNHGATLADALEAVLGAVFLDAKASGNDPFAATAVSFDAVFEGRIREMSPTDGLDPKSALQRIVQGRLRVAPRYRQVGEAPEPGQPPRWRVAVELRRRGEGTLSMGEGEGRSLQEAERAAAREALARLHDGDLELPPS